MKSQNEKHHMPFEKIISAIFKSKGKNWRAEYSVAEMRKDIVKFRSLLDAVVEKRKGRFSDGEVAKTIMLSLFDRILERSHFVLGRIDYFDYKAHNEELIRSGRKDQTAIKILNLEDFGKVYVNELRIGAGMKAFRERVEKENQTEGGRIEGVVNSDVEYAELAVGEAYIIYLRGKYKDFEVAKRENRAMQCLVGSFDVLYQQPIYFSVAKSLGNISPSEEVKRKMATAFERDKSPGLEEFVVGMYDEGVRECLADRTEGKEVGISPNLLLSTSYLMDRVLERIKSGFIERNIASMGIDSFKINYESCISGKFLPISTYKTVEYGKIRGEATKGKIEIEKNLVIVTTETLFSRFSSERKGLNQEISEEREYEIGKSNFGIFLNCYEDENLYREFMLVPASEFQRISQVMSENRKFISDITSGSVGVFSGGGADTGMEDSTHFAEFKNIVLAAINKGVNDIYFVYKGGTGRIEFRNKERILYKHTEVSQEKYGELITVLQNIAKVDTNAKKSQGASLKNIEIIDIYASVTHRPELRLQFTYNAHTGKTDLFVRIHGIKKNSVGPSGGSLLEKLGYDSNDLKEINSIFHYNSNGLIVITGPTNVGKSTLLHAQLSELLERKPDFHLLTAEDPIEQEILSPNAQQYSIIKSEEKSDDKNDDTGEAMIAAFLRMDPDGILVGEVRTKKLFSMLIDAALTGHIAFTTIHANNTREALDRLVDLFPSEKHDEKGALKQIIRMTRAITSQTLIPKICNSCKIRISQEYVRDILKGKWVPDDEINKMLSNSAATFFRRNHAGCSECEKGLKGVQVIVEIMNLSNPVTRKNIESGDFSGIKTLFEKGFRYVESGEIDMDILAQKVTI